MKLLVNVLRMYSRLFEYFPSSKLKPPTDLYEEHTRQISAKVSNDNETLKYFCLKCLAFNFHKIPIANFPTTRNIETV